MTKNQVQLLTIVLTYLSVKVVFAFTGFSYSIFVESFSFSKFLIDLGVWTLFYIFYLNVLNKLFLRSRSIKQQ
ncbi:MAG: hypothetical protein ACM3S2_11450 [Ignavibacteriales bacterium]